MADKRTITQICEDCLGHDELLAGCNLFVQAVLGALGYGSLFSKGDNADAMIAKFSQAPFHLITQGRDEATRQATAGKLVLAGLTKRGMTYMQKNGKLHSASMGHAVVVVPGGPSKARDIVLANGVVQQCRGGYPLCYGGAAMAQFRLRQRLSIDVVFPSKVLNDVVYAYLDLPAT